MCFFVSVSFIFFYLCTMCYCCLYGEIYIYIYIYITTGTHVPVCMMLQCQDVRRISITSNSLITSAIRAFR